MKLLIASFLFVSSSAFAGSVHRVFGNNGGGLALGVIDAPANDPGSCHVDFVIPPEGGAAVSKLICGDTVMN